MPKLYFSVCVATSQALTEKVAAECETLWQAECVVQDENAQASEKSIRETLASCDALIVVIGNGPSGRCGLTFDEPLSLDRIRIELVTALNLDVLIVPLLVDETLLPEKKGLPGALKLLHDSSAHRMRNAHWYDDLHLLFEELQKEWELKKEIEQKLAQAQPVQKALPAKNEPPRTKKWDPKTTPASELRRTLDSEKFNLKEARRRCDRAGEQKALSALAIAYTQLGQTRWAIHYFEEELKLVRDSGSAAEICALLANLGDAHAVSGDIDRAAGYYEEQLVLADSKGLREFIGSAHNGLGFVCVKRGQIAPAIEHYSQALAVYRELENHEKELELLVGIALNHQKRQDPESAKECLNRALSVAQYLENRREEARVAVDLAETCIQLGGGEEAKQHLDRADSIFSAITAEWAESWKRRIQELRQRLT